MDYNTLLRDNFNYYVTNIEPFYFLLYTTTNKIILIDPTESNFAHLVGIKSASNRNMASMSAIDIYTYLKVNDNVKSIFYLINYERYKNNELTTNEMFVLQKNIHFIELFEYLIHFGAENNIKKKIKLVSKNINEFDSDYFFVYQYENGYKGYISIKGDDKSKFKFRFNSVMYRNDTINSTNYTITKIEKIQKELINIEELGDNGKLIISERYRNINVIKNVPKPPKPFALIENIEAINKKLQSNCVLKKGRYKKSSVQIELNGIEVEKNLEQKIKEINESREKQKIQSVDAVIQYIQDEYIGKVKYNA